MKNKNVFLQAAMVGLLATGGGGLLAPSNAVAAEACYGINSCKGTGACGGKGYSCAGNNACKGQGFLKLEKDECLKRGGSLTPVAMVGKELKATNPSKKKETQKKETK